jgi:hypothetical protein
MLERLVPELEIVPELRAELERFQAERPGVRDRALG